MSLVLELLDALAFVHTAKDARGRGLGIVHRDVSPGNVILTSDGHAKLGDFGIVRSQAVVRRTQPGELKGKIGYMSPEQAAGDTVTHQSDLFSVGIILAEFLTLRPLFLGKTEMETLTRTVEVDLSTWHRYNTSVPLALRTVVERALEREVKNRYQSASEMREALLKICEQYSWSLESCVTCSCFPKSLPFQESVGLCVPLLGELRWGLPPSAPLHPVPQSPTRTSLPWFSGQDRVVGRAGAPFGTSGFPALRCHCSYF
jgi:serine/threonine protein kinase